MIPGSIVRAFLPKEAKDMLNALKGHKTLLLLVIANLPEAIHAVSNIASGVGNASLAENLTKATAGLLAVLTWASRLIPDPEPEEKK